LVAGSIRCRRHTPDVCSQSFDRSILLEASSRAFPQWRTAQKTHCLRLSRALDCSRLRNKSAGSTRPLDLLAALHRAANRCRTVLRGLCTHRRGQESRTAQELLYQAVAHAVGVDDPSPFDGVELAAQAWLRIRRARPRHAHSIPHTRLPHPLLATPQLILKDVLSDRPPSAPQEATEPAPADPGKPKPRPPYRGPGRFDCRQDGGDGGSRTRVRSRVKRRLLRA
jgi:hypothetical protein